MTPEYRLWYSQGIVKQHVPGQSHGDDAHELWHTGREGGGSEAGMDAQHWMGIAKIAEKRYG